MASRFVLPFADVGSGIKPSSGAKLFFFEDDGVTPKDTFTDVDATVPNTNPVVSDPSGVFGDIYIDGVYEVTLKDNSDIQIFPLSRVESLSSVIGSESMLIYANLSSWVGDTDESKVIAGAVASLTERTTGDDGGFIGDVIAGTGTANGFGIIAHGTLSFSLVVRTTNRTYAEMFGVNTSNTDIQNASALHSALDEMVGRELYIMDKRYKYSGVYAGSVNLKGDQRPTVNATRTALENGTILEGGSNFSGDYVYLTNIGFDHGSSAFGTGGNAFKASALPYNSGRLCVLLGVVGLGRDDADAFHGILVEGYENAWLSECVGVRNQFAIAVKSRNMEVDGCRAIEGQNGIIIKSDTGTSGGSASNVNLSNFNHEGSLNSEFSVRVLSDNAQLQRLNISNVNATGTDRVIALEATTALNEVNISGINASQVRKFGLVTSGAIFNINMSNIHIVDIDDFAAQFLSASHLTMNNCYFSLKATSTKVTDSIRVESGITGFIANNLKCIENRDNGILRGINFANATTQNNLSQVHALLSSNRPEPGFYSENVDGGVITPIYEGDRNQTTLIASATGPATITQIVTTMPGTTKTFPRGYRLTIISNGQTLTYTNATNMRMKVAGNQVRLVNQVIEFVWFGSSWHQADSTPA